MVVTVLAPGADGAASRSEMDGVEVCRARYFVEGKQKLTSGLGGILPNLESNRWLLGQVPPLVMSMAAAARRIALRGFDLIHAHWLFPGGLVGLLARGRLGIPLLVTSHGGDLNWAKQSNLAKRLSRSIARRADACSAVSEDLYDSFLQLGVPEDRVSLTPLGVDLAVTEDSRERDSSILRILYVGSLIPRKNVRCLVRALVRLRNLAVPFRATFVGDGPERAGLEAFAKRELLNAHFIGSLPHKGVRSQLLETDVLVLPSISEGRPVVLLEAMASSKPVVATDIPGNRELVDDGQTGFLFRSDDDAQLAAKLFVLWDNPNDTRRLGLAGRAKMLEEGLTTSQTAARFIELYRTLTILTSGTIER